MLFKAQARHDQDNGTLILAIDPADLSPHIDAILVDGARFNPKEELHITVIGQSAARRLSEAGVGAELVADLMARLPKSWRVRRLDRWWRIDDPSWQGPEDKEPQGRASIIEEVQCQEGEVFFAALSRDAGTPVPSPPFHITWYVRRDPRGIALPTAAVLQKVGTRIDSLA